jgi:hypothetical protein
MKRLADLAGGFPLLQVNNEAQAGSAGHGQIPLGDSQFPALRADCRSKLFGVGDIHDFSFPFGNITRYLNLFKLNITDRDFFIIVSMETG